MQPNSIIHDGCKLTAYCSDISLRILFSAFCCALQQFILPVLNVFDSNIKYFFVWKEREYAILDDVFLCAADYYVSKLREQVIYEGADSVAAIVVETITGSNGVIIPPEGYLKGVRAICDEFGIMMICDEVMAGWGRTGKMFAFENFGVKPDTVSFAKGRYLRICSARRRMRIKEHSGVFRRSSVLLRTYLQRPSACVRCRCCVS